MPGRYIGENIAFLRDVVELANEYNLPVALLSLDKEKAFDRVDWPFLFATLGKMAFADTLSGGSGFFKLPFAAPSLSMVTLLALSSLPVGYVKAAPCPHFSMFSPWKYWLLTSTVILILLVCASLVFLTI